ncbi:MAG: phytanoyl-CoA dioxygenase family protein [Rhodospirillaceae bacterium]|nr:phytanoyl-CoA dioxygenase family protein [Rhodospirillaceae bacterium]
MAEAREAIAIADADIAAYARDGVVCLRGLFGPDWVERLRVALARNMANPGPWHRSITKPGQPGNFYYDSMMSRADPEFRAFAEESPAAEIAGRIMGADAVRFFYDQLFVKEPGTLDPMPWHHDLPYWPFRGRQVCSIWLAIEDVTAAGSGVEFVAGSHSWGNWYLPQLPYDDNEKFRSLGLEPCPDFGARRADPALRFLTWDMRAGDCLVFSALTVHGSGGNTAMTHRRAALSTRWLGDDATWDPRPATATYYYEPDGAGLEPGDPVGGRCFPVRWRRTP